ncbi:MAG: hypothetical protein HRT51_16515 [Colwellia sp.]|nr:hypothetical protein [Colwellia sp.]
MTAKTQTILSVLISFIFYFTWTWYANSRVTDDVALLLRCALIQSSYSAFMTLTFTTLLRWTIGKMKCHDHPYLVIIPPLLMQSTTVYFINYLNQTPNLILTIIPGIFFTAIYGIFFTYTLLKKPEYQCHTQH